MFELVLGLVVICQKILFDIQEMIAPVSNREMVLLSLIVTGKFVAHFILLNLTSIISSAHNSHSGSEEESMLLSGLWESCGYLSSGSDLLVLGAHV